MTEPKKSGEFYDIRDHLLSQQVARSVTGENGAYAVLPFGYVVQPLEDLQARPNRIKADHTFADPKSLAAYVIEYGTQPNLFVTSDPKNGRISAILDYHDPVEDFHESLVAAQPRWAQHRARFQAVKHPSYEAWCRIDRQAVNQRDAGEFLEDHIDDIVEPVGADVMDMVMKFEALKSVRFSQSFRLRDGQTQLTYQEDNDAKGALTIPEVITLLLPIYEGMEPQRIKVRLRYRVADGKLSFSFNIANRIDIERQAFERCEDIFATEMDGGAHIRRV